jgi:hypothetical protein
LAEWDGGKGEEGGADCRYHDAMENYKRATKSFELLDRRGSYEELLAIYEYLNTPSEMVHIFNRTEWINNFEREREAERKKKKVPGGSGRYPWLNDVVEELKKRPEGTDPVNHPTHYANSCSLECIDLMELIFGRLDNAFPGFLLGNAFKYIWRHKKNGGLEDLEKAEWYLEKFDELDLCDEDFAYICEWLKNKIERARRDY